MLAGSGRNVKGNLRRETGCRCQPAEPLRPLSIDRLYRKTDPSTLQFTTIGGGASAPRHAMILGPITTLAFISWSTMGENTINHLRRRPHRSLQFAMACRR
jgi:hypothetical protein